MDPCTDAGAKEGGIRCHSPSYSFETRSVTESGARPVASKPKRSSCLCLPQRWGYKLIQLHLAFYVNAGDLNFGLFVCIASTFAC